MQCSVLQNKMVVERASGTAIACATVSTIVEERERALQMARTTICKSSPRPVRVTNSIVANNNLKMGATLCR